MFRGGVFFVGLLIWGWVFFSLVGWLVVLFKNITVLYRPPVETMTTLCGALGVGAFPGPFCLLFIVLL